MTNTSTVPPTIKDVSRAVWQLNDRQDEESLERVARNMAYVIGRNVRLHKLTKQGAAMMLACHGASDFTINSYAGPLAGRLRAYADEYGSLNASI